ncbi:uncharacterized protein LOC131429379 [Malaya genurostris]|uniref:uncharacterized protein LOC131429379 n=1 Tax=Malaya genurostris TaxID=325434 RepID=UPI0026F3DB19|nr:uncharacterized protein LOC131429379 [Malaya genurostris]
MENKNREVIQEQLPKKDVLCDGDKLKRTRQWFSSSRNFNHRNAVSITSFDLKIIFRLIKLNISFQISGFINVLGCIDGCYIYIRQPANKIRSTYVNRHDLLSITLQGICDSNKRFMDVCIGAPSKVHDARIFSISPISKELPVLCEGKFHLLGDAAYPLREYLLTPYKDYGTSSPRRRRYNIKHSQARVKIENAFGLLKQRFRQLVRLNFFDTERASKFVLACCVLHNICIDMDDSLPERIAIDMNENLPVVRQYDDENSQRSTALKLLREAKRSEIVNIIT